ncbi:MAG TPA: tripartite tricarboxylate transporter substrate-binding protein [Eoetvoesiella sp.]
MKKNIARWAALAACLSFSSALWASDYPAKDMSWVVPLAPGGPADTLSRSIANKMGQQLGKSIVIENVAGAGGTIGAGKAVNNPADGYHFLMGHMGFMGAAPSLYKQLSYDPVKDFKAVIRFPDTPAVLLVPQNPKFQTLQELVDYAKGHPGEVNFGTAGVGSASHLIAALFASAANIEVQMIPYKGNAPAMADLMGGRLDALFDQSNTALGHVRGGKVKALGVATLEPMKQFPNVPVVASIIPGFEAATWYGLYAPRNTSDEQIEVLHKAYLKVMGDADFTQSLSDQGVQLLSGDKYGPASFQKLTADEIQRWAKVIENAGIPRQ